MIKHVGSTKIRAKHRASCHCGTVVLELDLARGIVDPRRCDCSICRRKGTIVASVPLSGLKIIKGAVSLKVYQFNTRAAHHYFCANCGIHTHHRRRSNPAQYGFNVGCLEGVNPFEIPDVPTNDGVNHPADRTPNIASKPAVPSAVRQLFEMLPAPVQELALSSRKLVLTALPDAIEISDEKAKVVGYGYGSGYKDVVATLILSKTGVKIGLAYGASLPDPASLLHGTGKVHRYIEVRRQEQLRRPEVEQLLGAALGAWRERAKEAKVNKSRKRARVR
jgi:hypothetical protein